jgi:hypothetical protein
MLAVVKRLIGKDDPAELASEIEALKTSAADASAESEQLQAARLVAADYEATLAVDEQIKRARWVVDSAAAKLPDLEARLKAAQAEQHRQAISRHLSACRAIYPRLKNAILAAGQLQAEAIRLRDRAISEIGEHAAQVNLPIIAFRGLLLPDLIKLWSDELDRIVFAMAAPPRVQLAPPSSQKTAAAAKPARPAPAPRPKRQPRQAAEPADGEITVMFLRSGVDLEDGTQSLTGDVVNMPAAVARSLLESGAADVTGRSSKNA